MADYWGKIPGRKLDLPLWRQAVAIASRRNLIAAIQQARGDSLISRWITLQHTPDDRADLLEFLLVGLKVKSDSFKSTI
jgi:hypothetical protein